MFFRLISSAVLLRVANVWGGGVMASGAKQCTNLSMRYLTQKEAIALDEDLFNEYKYSVDQLMELAGLSVATAVARVYPTSTHQKALIVCGPGNNGGDGLVAARHMVLFGYNVSVHYPKRTAKPLYENLLAQCLAFGVHIVETLPPPKDLNNEYHVLVDALFGFSFKPPVRKELAPAMNALIETNLPVCSASYVYYARNSNRKTAMQEKEYTLEARLEESSVLKKLFDAIKDLLTRITFDCDENGIQFQAMDSSHVALVSLTLGSNGFDKYKCDRPISMGINVASMSKILKCAGDKDTVTIKAQANSDTMTLVFESPNQNKVSEYEMKLMNLDTEQLSIPETEYSCTIRLPSGEFARICRDLSQFGESIFISCTKEGLKFSAFGDIGSANIKLAQTASIDKDDEGVVINVQEPVTLPFACQYLHYFSKGSSLSPQVQLSMSAERPLIVEYRIPAIGHICYYLAPKIEEDD